MMTVRLIAHTPEPEKVVAAAAKLCYSDAHITDLLDGLDEEKTARFLTMLSDLGHASPIEHASFTFGIEGVSRTLLAQITRHRIASFSVQSQRYVRLDDFRYVIPPEIEAIPEAKAAFIESMNEGNGLPGRDYCRRGKCRLRCVEKRREGKHITVGFHSRIRRDAERQGNTGHETPSGELRSSFDSAHVFLHGSYDVGMAAAEIL